MNVTKNSKYAISVSLTQNGSVVISAVADPESGIHLGPPIIYPLDWSKQFAKAILLLQEQDKTPS